MGGTLALDAANVAGHGVIGGATNVAMGGKFQDGFLSGALAAATAKTGLTDPNTDVGRSLGFAGRTAIASIAGGTASVIGGGKFANGAMTGAMTHMLNAEAAKKLKVGAYADGAANGNHTNAFKHRSELGAGKNTFGFSSLRTLIDGLMPFKNIDSLDIHGHGFPEYLATGDPNTRIYEEGYSTLAGRIAGGDISVAKNGKITIFACNQDTPVTELSNINSNAKYFAAMLNYHGRGDIIVTAANGHVSPNVIGPEKYAHVYDGGKRFTSYQYGKEIGHSNKLNYAR
ncbi:MAG: hypothetical protein HC845_12095 [Akkermansiaceae bacterium]|nr:hypothetical protein [Akkermansiaceae bacterium]